MPIHSRLYPGSLEGEAKAWQWSLWAVNEVDRGVNIWSLHAVRLPPEEQDFAKRVAALKVLEVPFRVLDAAVKGRNYLVGDEFTVADLNVAAVISRAVDMDLSAVPNPQGLAQPLPRPAGGARGAETQKAGRRRGSARGDAADCEDQPAVTHNRPWPV